MKRITIERGEKSVCTYPNGEVVIRTLNVINIDKIIEMLHPPMGYDEELEVWEEPSVETDTDDEFEK